MLTSTSRLRISTFIGMLTCTFFGKCLLMLNQNARFIPRSEMTMRVVYNVFYEIIVHTHRFNTAVVTLKCVGATGEEEHRYPNLAETNPKWVAPSEAIRKEFMSSGRCSHVAFTWWNGTWTSM